MEFKEISLCQAENTILAHSLNLKKRKLKKGTLLTREDVIELEENGYRWIMYLRELMTLPAYLQN